MDIKNNQLLDEQENRPDSLWKQQINNFLIKIFFEIKDTLLPAKEQVNVAVQVPLVVVFTAANELAEPPKVVEAELNAVPKMPLVTGWLVVEPATNKAIAVRPPALAAFLTQPLSL